MANILQAAKWMKEGKEVTRPDWCRFRAVWNDNFGFRFASPHTQWRDWTPHMEDLLADDWEIAE